MFRADFLPFTLKTVEHSRHLLPVARQQQEQPVAPQAINIQASAPAPRFQEEDDEPEQPPITEQQLHSIRKLCEYLGKAEPEGIATMSNLDAKKVIQQLTAEYRQMKKAS